MICSSLTITPCIGSKIKPWTCQLKWNKWQQLCNILNCVTAVKKLLCNYILQFISGITIYCYGSFFQAVNAPVLVLVIWTSHSDLTCLSHFSYQNLLISIRWSNVIGISDLNVMFKGPLPLNRYYIYQVDQVGNSGNSG